MPNNPLDSSEQIARANLASDDALPIADESASSDAAKAAGVTLGNLISNTHSDRSTVGGLTAAAVAGLVADRVRGFAKRGDAGTLPAERLDIESYTNVDAAVEDFVAIGDASDSNNTKRTTVQKIIDLAGSGLDINGLTNSLTNSTIADADLMVVSDSDASNELKKITIGNLKTLFTSSGGGGSFAIKDLTAISSLGTTDQFAVADAGDSNNNKKVTLATLKDAVSTYANPTTLTSSGNLNTLSDGWYIWGDPGPTGAHGAEGGLLQFRVADNDQQWQIEYKYDGTVRTRRHYDDNTWSSWQEGGSGGGGSTAGQVTDPYTLNSSDDINTRYTPGYYAWGAAPQNASGNNGAMLVFIVSLGDPTGNADRRVFQWEFQSAGTVRSRVLDSAGAWSGWTSLGSGGSATLDINSLTGKTTPVDADQLVIADSAASNANKKLTFANLIATIQNRGSFDISSLTAVTATGLRQAHSVALHTGSAQRRATLANLAAFLTQPRNYVSETSLTAGHVVVVGDAVDTLPARATIQQIIDLAAGQSFSINGLTAVTSLQDADTFAFNDSSDSNTNRKITFENLKTAIGTGGGVAYSSTDAASIAASDNVLFFDGTDSNNLKRESLSDLMAAGSFYINIASRTQTTPEGRDSIMFADASSSNVTRKCLVSDILTLANAQSFSINGLTAKTTPVVGDSIAIADSADSGANKKITITQLSALVGGPGQGGSTPDADASTRGTISGDEWSGLNAVRPRYFTLDQDSALRIDPAASGGDVAAHEETVTVPADMATLVGTRGGLNVIANVTAQVPSDSATPNVGILHAQLIATIPRVVTATQTEASEDVVFAEVEIALTGTASTTRLVGYTNTASAIKVKYLSDTNGGTVQPTTTTVALRPVVPTSGSNIYAEITNTETNDVMTRGTLAVLGGFAANSNDPPGCVNGDIALQASGAMRNLSPPLGLADQDIPTKGIGKVLLAGTSRKVLGDRIGLTWAKDNVVYVQRTQNSNNPPGTYYHYSNTIGGELSYQVGVVLETATTQGGSHDNDGEHLVYWDFRGREILKPSITNLATATPSATDNLPFSDEGTTGDPDRKATVSAVVNTIRSTTTEADGGSRLDRWVSPAVLRQTHKVLTARPSVAANAINRGLYSSAIAGADSLDRWRLSIAETSSQQNAARKYYRTDLTKDGSTMLFTPSATAANRVENALYRRTLADDSKTLALSVKNSSGDWELHEIALTNNGEAGSASGGFGSSPGGGDTDSAAPAIRQLQASVWYRGTTAPTGSTSTASFDGSEWTVTGSNVSLIPIAVSGSQRLWMKIYIAADSDGDGTWTTAAGSWFEIPTTNTPANTPVIPAPGFSSDLQTWHGAKNSDSRFYRYWDTSINGYVELVLPDALPDAGQPEWDFLSNSHIDSSASQAPSIVPAFSLDDYAAFMFSVWWNGGREAFSAPIPRSRIKSVSSATNEANFSFDNAQFTGDDQATHGGHSLTVFLDEMWKGRIGTLYQDDDPTSGGGRFNFKLVRAADTNNVRRVWAFGYSGLSGQYTVRLYGLRNRDS